MKIASLFAASAVAAGAVLFAAAPAQAELADVLIVPGGAACPSGYSEIAQIDQTTICYDLNVPDWKLIIDGAPCNSYYDTGWTEYSVLNRVRLCVKAS